MKPTLELKQGEMVVLTARQMQIEEPCLDITADCSLDRDEVTVLRNWLTLWLQQTETVPRAAPEAGC